MTARDLHRLAGTRDRLRRAAATGPCHLAASHACPNTAVGWIERWDGQPFGVCTVHAEQGRQLRYTVHTLEELQ